MWSPSFFQLYGGRVKLRVVAVVMSLSFVGVMGCSTKASKDSTSAPTGAAPSASASPSASPSPNASPVAQPQAKSAAPVASGKEMTCSRASEQRKLEVEAVQPKGCTVWYTKFGERSNIASSTVGEAHCNTVRDRIKGNLEAAGFACK